VRAALRLCVPFVQHLLAQIGPKDAPRRAVSAPYIEKPLQKKEAMARETGRWGRKIAAPIIYHLEKF
jgi:hypothetical protein